MVSDLTNQEIVMRDNCIYKVYEGTLLEMVVKMASMSGHRPSMVGLDIDANTTIEMQLQLYIGYIYIRAELKQNGKVLDEKHHAYFCWREIATGDVSYVEDGEIKSSPISEVLGTDIIMEPCDVYQERGVEYQTLRVEYCGKIFDIDYDYVDD